MKKIVTLLLISVLLLSCVSMLSSCGHEHTWTPATFDSPKTCYGCGATEGQSIKKLIEGEWRNDTGYIYLTVTFTGNEFTADMAVGDQLCGGIFANHGTVEMTGNVLTLWESNGNKYSYYTYEIIDGTIHLTDDVGDEWIKMD